MFIELGHSREKTREDNGAAALSTFAGLRGMVCESVGAVRHEVSVPFHDSQVRGIALLIQTGWDQRWGQDAYWESGPFLADHLIFRMVRAGVRLVGVDFPVTERSTETRLITTGKIAIVENLQGLVSLPRVGFRFTLIPIEAAVNSACAVRALAEIT
jgi:arylformamidase